MSQENRTPERLILIGCKGFVGIDAVSWSEQVVPNIPDYDVVVVSVPHITEEFLREVDTQFFVDMRNALVRFLDSQGRLVVLLSPVLTVRGSEKQTGRVSNLDWCPIVFETPEGTQRFGDPDSDFHARLIVRDWAFFTRIAMGGDIGFGEA